MTVKDKWMAICEVWKEISTDINSKLPKGPLNQRCYANRPVQGFICTFSMSCEEIHFWSRQNRKTIASTLSDVQPQIIYDQISPLIQKQNWKRYLNSH